jgi:hypothetical protein
VTFSSPLTPERVKLAELRWRLPRSACHVELFFGHFGPLESYLARFAKAQALFAFDVDVCHGVLSPYVASARRENFLALIFGQAGQLPGFCRRRLNVEPPGVRPKT